MTKHEIEWAQLLREAVERPGLILEAYRAFHNYSLGNQIAAAWQCSVRDIPHGPINTFRGWQERGRQVRKGEKAILLCMPYKGKRRVKEDDGEEKTVAVIRGFDWKANWFVLAQTDGPEGDGTEEKGNIPFETWNKTAALSALEIEEIPFEHPNGNVQGFARGRMVSVSPLAALPHKTLFHEIAHVVLGHTVQGECSDAETLPRSLIEAEAESVAYLICHSLGLPGAEYSRGYIQHWLKGEELPESSARRIFSAADKVLKSGR